MGACKPKQHPIVIIPEVEKNHLQRNHLFGNIEKITSTLYYITEEDSTKTKTKISTTKQHFSADGFLVKVLTSDQFDNFISKQEIFYNQQAKEEYWIETDSNGTVVNRCEYEYDANQYICKEKIFHLDSLVYSISYKTDGIGNIIEILQDHIHYKLKNIVHYNDNGLIIRIDEYDPQGKLFKYVTIEYDNYGDEVNRRVYKGENNIIEYTYTQYDENGRMHKIIYEDRIHKLIETYNYSEHDKAGNWTLEERKKANHDTYLRERIIDYY